MSVTLYVEGGGDYKALKSECRRGFKKLLKNSGFDRGSIKVNACGPRNDAFDNFRTALKQNKTYPILLVDSEDLVKEANSSNNPSGAWNHLHERDGWQKPKSASDDQAQLMVTTMETWLIADSTAVINHFPGVNVKKLPSFCLEGRSKKDILAALKKVTSTSKRGEYKKGRDSFDLLGNLDPEELKGKLPHFRRLVNALDAIL